MKDLPDFLMEKRSEIECNFVFTLIRDPELIPDYKNVVNEKDIITEDGTFYYGIAQGMSKAGFTTFDNMAFHTFLADKPAAKKRFDDDGGYRQLQEIIELVAPNNIDKYYEELTKSNFLIRLYQDGFPIADKLDKFKVMSSEQIYDYYEYKLADIAVGKIEKIKTENLSDGYDEYIEEWDKGNMQGFRITTPILNYMLAGVHKKNLLLHLAGVGKGKTTTALYLYVLGAIESGENVLIIANEQGVTEFRQMILATVLFNRISGDKHGMNRQKFIIGHFTDDQKKLMKEAAAWLKRQKGKIQFVEMNDYDINNVKKTVKKYSKIGYGLILFDTLKPLDEASDKAWAEFSEAAKALFQLAKICDVAVICTAQLSSESMSRRYLDLSCIGKSRAIAETASTVVAFRHIMNDEYDKIKPYSHDIDENGKRTGVKKIHDLDPSKQYIMVFVMKNRFGPTDPQIVMEFNQSFNKLKEVGYYSQPYDSYRR